MPAADRSAPLNEKVGVGDTAQAETELPLSPAEAGAFLGDVERLLRLNPMLAIERWQPAEGGFRFTGHNESNGCTFDILVTVLPAPAGDALELRYDNGLKQATSFVVVPVAGGTRLVVTEHYPHVEDPQDPRLVEVDKSLVPWVAAIRCHLRARRRWRRFPGWRWWHERVMPSMVPRSRRIVRLLVWTTVAEFAVFLGLVVVLRFAA